MANLAQPEKFQTWKQIKDEEDTSQALALHPERPCCKFDSCCKFDGSRREWLDGNEEAGVMEYQEEPWAREDRCSPCQTNFVVTLMMRKSDSDSTDEDYVPKLGSKEEGSSSIVDKPKKNKAMKHKPRGKGDERLMLEIDSELDSEHRTALRDLLRLELDEQKGHDLELSQLDDDVLQP